MNASESNVGFRILPKDTLERKQKEPEIKPPTMVVLDDLL